MSELVMVVDDSMMVRTQVRRALAGADFEVIEAVDGVAALEKARALPNIALMIVDVNMPRMNGLDFLAALRQEEHGRDVPVVILTTEAQPELAARARSLNARGWIIKPFDPAMLVAAAKRLVSMRAA